MLVHANVLVIMVKTTVKENIWKDHIQFMMGQDESYTNIRGQILLMQPLPLVVKVYSMRRQK